MEAAYFEKYVAVGKHTENFQEEISRFIHEETIKIIASKHDFIAYIQEVISNTTDFQEKQKRAKKLALYHQNALETTVTECQKLFQ